MTVMRLAEKEEEESSICLRAVRFLETLPIQKV